LSGRPKESAGISIACPVLLPWKLAAGKKRFSEGDADAGYGEAGYGGAEYGGAENGIAVIKIKTAPNKRRNRITMDAFPVLVMFDNLMNEGALCVTNAPSFAYFTYLQQR
jgi:hypothetical protein